MVALLHGQWSRWAVLLAGIFVSIWCGSTYAFGLISQKWRDDFGWTQKELQMIGTIGNIGSYAGLFAGIFYDKFGPRRTIAIGSVVALVGWGLLWIFTAKIASCSQVSVAVAYFIGANAQTWFDTAALVTNIGNFPGQRSVLIGLEKSYTGLGASVLSEAYTGLFRVGSTDDGVTPFLLAMSISLCIVPLICAIFIVKIKENVESESEPVKSRFVIGYLLTSILAAILLGAALAQHFSPESLSIRYGFLVAVAVLLLSLFVIPYVGKSNDYILPAINDASPLLQQTMTMTVNPVLGELPLRRVLFMLDYWLLFFIFALGTGAGITVINNIAQMYLALAGDGATNSDSAVYVAVLSVANCFGRLIVGSVSHRFERTIPRPLFAALTTFMMGLSILLLAYADLDLLYLGCILVGLAYGGYWALVPALTSDLFGQSSLGANYNFLSIGTSIATYLMCVELAGSVYDEYAEPSSSNSSAGLTSGVFLPSVGASSSLICKGRHCFYETYMIIAGLCGVGTLLTVWLTIRTWRPYMRTFGPRM